MTAHNRQLSSLDMLCIFSKFYSLQLVDVIEMGVICVGNV